MPLWRPRFHNITHLDLLVQMGRHASFALHTDPIKTVRWRTRQAIRADVHLAVEGKSHRQMLARKKHRQTGAIVWLQINRADAVAFPFDLRHPQRPPLVAQSLRLQTRIGLRPVSSQQTGGRHAVEAPAQGQRGWPANQFLHLECPKPFGALKRLDLRPFQNEFGTPAELQQIACGKVDEQQASLGVEQ